MNVNRPELLQALQSVSPGLAAKETVEQSSCFVFQNGFLYTYNGEVACRRKCDIGVEGALTSTSLMSILEKLPEEDLEVELKNNEVLFKGQGRKFSIGMQAEIALPIDSVERPKEWAEIEEDFEDAVQLAVQCCTKDDTKGFCYTCVHIHPKYVEGCDNLQMGRYPIRSGVSGSTLVKRETIKAIIGLGMTKICETESWLHFKGAGGLVISCRRYVEEFPDLSTVLEVNGEITSLPGGLAEAVEKANVFSAENSDNDSVMVELRPGKLRVTGRGNSGWYQEMKTIKYDGEPIMFMISPKLLMEISKRHNECIVTPDRLKFDGGKFAYVACLGRPEEV